MAKNGQMHFVLSGLCHDVLHIIGKYGLAPELPTYQTTDNINYVYINFQNLKDNLSGKGGIGLEKCANLQRSFLDTCPKVFEYKNKQYSPTQFRDSILRFNRSDYGELSSFSDSAFYSYFVLNVPDNWMQAKYFNLPMDTLANLCISSLKKGYTFVWDGDVSEYGYGYVSVLHKQDNKQVKKLGLDGARMEQFNKHQTTDGHLMHVVGLAKGKYNLALKNSQVLQATLQQAETDFEQNTLLAIEEFNLQKSLVKGAAEADTLARIAYNLSKKRFMIGNVDVTKLFATQNAMIAAQKAYIASLEQYWRYYYTIRQLTLYDFEKNKALIDNFNETFGFDY